MAERSESAKRKILTEARTRFKRVEAWEAVARTRFTQDIKFVEGDSDNMYQWPSEIMNRMEADQKAMLTINKTAQHCLDVLNDARQSRISIKIRPTGGGASFDAAQAFMSTIRHVEYISNASTAYQNGLEFAVRGGIGYWRLVTDYANDNSFDQEIFIRRVKDSLTVYIDPDIVEFDGSDANFAFVFTDINKDEWKRKNPGKSLPANAELGTESWVGNSVRTAEYFRRVEKPDRLLAYPDPDDPENTKTVRESELPKRMAQMLAAAKTTQMRSIKSHKVEWFKIEGDEIIEEREWLGIYIPIIRCVGRETVIEGQLDRKGHTRALKDPQRMFNYNASGSVEFGALQSKSPYIAPADSIEGYETYWNTANTENHSVLPFNHRDDEGEEIPAPTRQQPPTGAPVFMQGMSDAAEWMRMVSGQYQADMGAPSNERSGAAINARARQGDNATYHFLDHQAIAIRFTAKQLLDLIPKIYDTKRVIQILADDGTESSMQIDPNAPQAFQKVQEERSEVASIFNPSVGKYEVEADTGPAFQTQRQEAWNSFLQIMGQDKDLIHIIGDIAFRMADFPGAEEIAERLKRMVPAQALQDGPPPDLVQAQKQIQALQELVKQVTQKLADKTAAHANDQEKNAVTAYKAQTDRLGALKDALAMQPEKLMELVRQVIEEAESTSAEGLTPALTQTPMLSGPEVAAAMAPPQAPQASGAIPSPGGAPNANPGDVTAAPSAGSGQAMTPGAPQ